MKPTAAQRNPSNTRTAHGDTGAPPRERFIRQREVQHITGISRTHVYRLIAAGEFPKPVRLGVQSVAWLESEVTAWMQRKIAAVRGGDA